jgi:hypothetical protein
MLRKYLGIMVILIVVLVGALLYLTWHASPEKSTGEVRFPTTTTTPTLTLTYTPAPPAAEPTQQAIVQAAVPAKPFDMSRASWMEYQMTTDDNGQPSTSTVKLECSSGNSGGAQTQLFTRTVTSGGSSYASTALPGVTYGLQVYSTQSSSTSSSTTSLGHAEQDDPIMSADGISGIPIGSDSITVPKGTYDCAEYAGDFGGADSTYWAAAGIPVPVKVYTACDGTTYELIDWG